jgi:hypothetical protein
MTAHFLCQFQAAHPAWHNDVGKQHRELLAAQQQCQRGTPIADTMTFVTQHGKHAGRHGSDLVVILDQQHPALPP